MPPKTRITKELIIEKSFEITKSEGIENLNARYLAKQLNCSTMPIFKVFNDMNELKFELKKKIDAYYNDFILAHLDKNNYLYTMSFAYIDFAIKEKNLFGALFVNEFIKTRSIEEVVNPLGIVKRLNIQHNNLVLQLKKVRYFIVIFVFIPMELQLKYMVVTWL